MTYTDGGVLVQLVFGCDAKACAVAASGPGQVDCCLQLVAHLLVDGASKLGTIIASETGKGEMSCYKGQNIKLLHQIFFSLQKSVNFTRHKQKYHLKCLRQDKIVLLQAFLSCYCFQSTRKRVMVFKLGDNMRKKNPVFSFI